MKKFVEKAMSALGHKQTCAVQTGMSALPPIATTKADSRNRSCLLYTRKHLLAAIYTRPNPDKSAALPRRAAWIS